MTHLHDPLPVHRCLEEVQAPAVNLRELQRVVNPLHNAWEDKGARCMHEISGTRHMHISGAHLHQAQRAGVTPLLHVETMAPRITVRTMW